MSKAVIVFEEFVGFIEIFWDYFDCFLKMAIFYIRQIKKPLLK